MSLMFRALILAVFLGSFALAAQDKPAPSPQQQFAQTVVDLGNCQQEASRYKAAVISGLLLDAVQVKAKLEAANPAYVFDPQTFTITPKPPKAPEKPKG
jgi:hypothetical protein